MEAPITIVLSDSDVARLTALQEALLSGLADEHVACFHEGDCGPRQAGLLGLLAPALRASVRARRDFHGGRMALVSMLEQLDAAVMVTTLDGRVVHETPALTRLLSSDPDRDAIVDHVRRAAARPDEEQGLRTAAGRYRVFVSDFPGPRASRGFVCAALERVGGRPLSDDDLRARFEFTERELEVAKLLRQGRATGDVARSLNISTYTARHHLEHVQRKLGVHSRAQAVALLVGADAGGDGETIALRATNPTNPNS